MARMIDYQSFLAVDLGSSVNWTKPQVKRSLLINRCIKASDWDYVLNCNVEFTGNQGQIYVRDSNRWVFVDTTDWERIEIITPIKKPRDGREYTWEYSMGQWRKTWKESIL